MIVKQYLIWEEGEYTYPLGCGFTPNVMGYLHEESEARPCMIVVPGGGYQAVSPTEGEIVAKKFFDMGYQAFVLTYTTNFLTMPEVPLKLQPMQDLSKAIRFVRKNAEKYNVDKEKIAVCGFSAGAHVCGTVCVHHEDFSEENEEYQEYSNRPDAAILGYPVISMEEPLWETMLPYVLGTDATEDEKAYLSLEKQVQPETPPCFIWQTAMDELVSVEYSFAFANACRKNHVPFAYHVFQCGPHGQSTADEDFAAGKFGEPYTMEQIGKIMEAIQNKTCPYQEAAQRKLAQMEIKDMLSTVVNSEVRIWLQMVSDWLKNVFKAD